MNIIIFGAGRWGRQCLAYLVRHKTEYHVIGVWDNNPKTHGKIQFSDLEVPVAPPGCTTICFDKVLVAVDSREHISQIQYQLTDLNIPKEKVEIFFESPLFEKVMAEYVAYDEYNDRRVGWLRDFARYVEEKQYDGNVAECGVNRGNFAFYINKYFPMKMLYLFDSFESFSEADLQKEREFGDKEFLSSAYNTKPHELFKTSENIVMGKLLHPEKCIIKKGYVPETLEGIDDVFCFVNLDMDLYQPMLAAMKFFYPRMVPGGIILLHDYFCKALPGVKRAVVDFETANGHAAKIPIGDNTSIAIIKN